MSFRPSSSLVLAAVLGCQLMVVVDATIVNVALPDIQRAQGFSSASLSWVLNAYTLTFGGLLLLGARMGEPRREASRRRAGREVAPIHRRQRRKPAREPVQVRRRGAGRGVLRRVRIGRRYLLHQLRRHGRRQGCNRVGGVVLRCPPYSAFRGRR